MKQWLVWAGVALMVALSSAVFADPEVVEATEEDIPANVIYRTRMPDGSFKLSDEPVNDSSEPMTLPGLPQAGTVTPVRRERPEASKREEPKPVFVASEYSLSIDSPSNGEAFVHPDEVSIGVNVSPGLPEGYQLELLHGGSPIDGTTITMPSRGGHSVQARIVDPQGKVVLTSNTVQFTVLRPSRLIN